ncbi:MAG: hypothetical protein ACRD2D_07255, partial [Terriglobales bacterium]
MNEPGTESGTESRTDQPNPNPSPQARQHDTAHDSAPEAAAISPRKALAGVGLILVVFVVLAVVGIVGRMHSRDVLARTTTANAPPTVIALPAKPGAPMDNFV